MIKISVIIPVYNVEKYLLQCVESVMYQTYKNIEIILVNDGSTDGSALLCDNLQKKDKRIKVIHKLNNGLGSARNSGLEIATGEYVFFLDSDDWVDESCLSDMLESAIKNKSDLVLTGETLFFEDTGEFGPGWRNFENESPIKINNKNFIKYFTPACGRLYNNKFLKENKLKFIRNCYYEDNSWGILCSILAKKISFTRNHYFYRQRKTSITGQKDYKIIDWCFDFFYFYNYVNQNNIPVNKKIYGYMWYILNFFNYSQYIKNLNSVQKYYYLYLIKKIFLKMNLSKNDFKNNSIFNKEDINKIYRYYNNITKRLYVFKTTKHYFLHFFPIIKSEIMHII